MKRKHLSTRVDPDILSNLAKLCAVAHYKNLSYYIRYLLKKGVDDEKKKYWIELAEFEQ